MSISHAPWTEKQVEQLKIRQQAGHPYTCPTHSVKPLVPTTEGWHCPLPDCDYTQDWCRAADINTTSLEFRVTELESGTTVMLNITEETDSAYIIIDRQTEPNETPNLVQMEKNGVQRTMLRLPLEVLFTIVDGAVNYGDSD